MLNKRIKIDPGHYGRWNISPVNNNYSEGEMVWELSHMLKEELEKYGAEVSLTRAAAELDMGLMSRGRSSKGFDLFISVHSNAANDSSIDYPLAITNKRGTVDSLGRKLVKVIEEKLNTKQSGKVWHKQNSRGTEWYGVLRGADEVGTYNSMILEHSFHTNKKVADQLLDKKFLRELAKVEAQTIANYLGMSETHEESSLVENITIMGKSTTVLNQMVDYTLSKNKKLKREKIEAIAENYLKIGNDYELRGDIAFCQALKETGFFKFGNLVEENQNNFAGIGATGPGNPGAIFKDYKEGVEAHIQHLFAYASVKAIPEGHKLIDPRFHLVTRGSAKNWVDLNGRWAVPGDNYGEDIIKLSNEIKALPKTESASDWAKEAWNWAIKNKLTDGSHPKDNMTREEMMTVLFRFNNLSK